MAEITHINGVAVANVSNWNGRAVASVSHIIGIPLNVGTASDIDIDFQGTETYIDNSTSRINAYDEVVQVGTQSGDVFTLNIHYYAYFETNISSIAFYYSFNSTSSWTLLKSYTADGDETNSVTGIELGDVVRFRCDIQMSGLGYSGEANLVINSGTITTGSGTVTIGSPNNIQIFATDEG